MLRVLDLFSGIGGFSLGLERAGMKTVAFCEIEPYARRVLRKHWPEVPIYEDVRTLTTGTLRRDGIAVDLICGGFPCQDISLAGKGAGLAGERSGLWREFARLIGELRPRYVIVENVAALLGRGLGTVLGDLAALGFDAEWHCIPASAVGAPHRRDRVWILGYSDHGGGSRLSGEPWWLREPRGQSSGASRQSPIAASASVPMANAVSSGLEVRPRFGSHLAAQLSAIERDRQIVADPHLNHEYGRRGDVQMGRLGIASEAQADGFSGRIQWLTEPDVGRVAHGVPARVDRLRGLGNAVVPQIPEIIGRAILAAEATP